jgi:hypothetical protein
MARPAQWAYGRWWHRSPLHEAEAPRPPATRQGAAILQAEERLWRGVTPLPRPFRGLGRVGIFRLPVSPMPVPVWAPRGYQGEAFLRLGWEIQKAHPSGLAPDTVISGGSSGGSS